MDTIPSLGKELAEIKKKLEQLNEEMEPLKKREYVIEKTLLPELMMDQDIQSVNIEGVGGIYKKVDAFVNVKKENEDSFFEWLVANGESDLIKATVHPSTLKAWAKARLLEGHALPDMVNYTPTVQAVLRKGR